MNHPNETMRAISSQSTSELPTAASVFRMAKIELEQRGLESWNLFCDLTNTLDTEMREALVAVRGGDMPRWEPFLGALPASRLGIQSDGNSACEVVKFSYGVWWHKKSNVMLLRFPTLEAGVSHPSFGRFMVVAAPDADAFEKLMLETHSEKMRRRRAVEVAEWKEVSSKGTYPLHIDREEAVAQPVLLSPKLEADLDLHVRGFFTDAWKSLCKRNRIPYRRGVLLHGQPGNGKTSLIRKMLVEMPKVSAVFLQKSLRLDDDDFASAIAHWRESAPCVLVIEDLDSLFDRIPVSTFLNQIDGIRPLKEEGLLMIATTNHPEKLDPAINNRPGRFDVAIRFDSPDAALRESYFHTMLSPEEIALLKPDDIRSLVRASDGLSFSHLREIFLRAGMTASNAGREGRLPSDLIGAAQSVSKSSQRAGDGFKEESGGFGFGGAQ